MGGRERERVHTTESPRTPTTTCTVALQPRRPKSSQHSLGERARVGGEARDGDADVVVHLEDLLLVRGELVGRPLQRRQHHIVLGPQAQRRRALLLLVQETRWLSAPHVPVPLSPWPRPARPRGRARTGGATHLHHHTAARRDGRENSWRSVIPTHLLDGLHGVLHLVQPALGAPHRHVRVVLVPEHGCC